jgi:transposase
MREDDGRKLDHKTLEQLRIRAVRRIEQGAHPEDIAQALGMTRAAVYSWLAKYRQGGLEALRAKPVPGRPPTLSGAQLARLYHLVVGNDPRQLQFAFALWTRAMVRELIRREFAVALSAVSVGRLLRKLGLSPQRPLYRAYQQNPQAVARWKAETYPQIRAEAAATGGTVYFADEAGVRSDYHAGTTWAPVGKTPVVAATGDRFAVNLISAVSAKGALRFAAYEGNLNAVVFLDFCRRLLADATGPVFLVLDGHPVHRSNAVKQFAAASGGRLRLCFLPGYSPELNPDEWVWKHVKHDRIGRAGVSGPEDLKAKALAALHRLQKLPHCAGVLPRSEPALHHRLNSPPTYIRLGNSTVTPFVSGAACSLLIVLSSLDFQGLTFDLQPRTS